ncbi:zinc-binding dehydrogenase [Pseudomonas corrugata]|uniref:zinc-binding dehydrogenase n=1 Tax=Pseudomonas corrugata TaxID=47879 RepID=UPI001586D9DA|nr:zinc-binding dehydrogenase [Pseudomonas corrugata]MCI0995686.1 zinc-binding dehydrogenase [Pseudomonas corrugata]NUT69290.1 zinc-binding dehydrogenase [Pseudomonas corrugata]
MKAVVMGGSGEPQNVLSLKDVNELTSPGPGEAIVRLHKRIIHPADYQTIRGYLPAEIFTKAGVPGIDGVGVVEEIGTGADPDNGIEVGTRVIVYHTKGTWTERVVVPTATLMPVPDDIEDAVACQLATNGVTGLMLHRAVQQAIGDTDEKETILVTAAGSGVAQNLIALTIASGRKVIGLVRHDADAAALSKRFGDLQVIGTDRPEWQAEVKEAAGQPASAAVDPIGGEMLPALLGLLAPGGTLVTYGALDPRPAPISSGFLTSFELTIRGCNAMGWAVRTSAKQRAADFNVLFELARQSPFLFEGYSEFSLAQVVDAIAAAEASPRRGATILVSGQ